jgi:DNA-binding CsgD family transcriptional regulator
VDGLRLLAPHIRRVVTISNLFDMKTIEASSYASVFESFAFGLVLVDASLKIVHANRAAQAILAARDPMRTELGKLTLLAHASQAALERAVLEATRDEGALGHRGIGIPASCAEGEPCVIHVLPLKRGEMRKGVGPRASAALFIAPATSPPRLPADALVLLYDLTPAETRIFELLVSGMTQAEISTALGIAPSTVKTHVLHLFDKTGCQRQADLLRLATTLSLPV